MEKFIKYAPVSDFPNRVGSAIQFGMSTKKDKESIVATVEMAAQTKPKPAAGSTESPFDWQNTKIFMQLNDKELAQILALFRGRLNEVKVIHKSPIDGPEDKQTTSSLTMGIANSGDCSVTLQQKKPGATAFTKYNIFLKPEDVEILFVLFTEIIKHMYFTPIKESNKVY